LDYQFYLHGFVIQTISGCFKSPLTIAILCYLLFTAVSVITSEILIVSVKALVVKILFVISFYGGSYIYFNSENNRTKFIKYYLIPLVAVIAFILFRHADFSFSKDASGFVTRPFFRIIRYTALCWLFAPADRCNGLYE